MKSTKKFDRYSVTWCGLFMTVLSTAICCAQSASGVPSSPEQLSAPSSEQWSALSIQNAGLHMQPPLLGERTERPDFIRELVRLEWRPGDPIDLYVIRAKGVARPPVVLYLYGYPSDADRFRNDVLCKNLTRDGFAAIGFTSALTGQRYHDRPMQQWFVSDLDQSLGATVHDVQMILNYLNSRDDLEMSRVGIFGQGSGGAIALLSAAADTRIKAVDVMDPWGDWPDWLAKSPRVPDDERAAYLAPAFLGKVAPLDPLRVLPQLQGRNVRIQQTSFDADTTEAVRKTIASSAPNTVEMIEYRNATEYREKVVNGGKIARLDAPAAESVRAFGRRCRIA